MARFAWKRISQSARGSSSNFRLFPHPRRQRPPPNMHSILIVDDEAGIRDSLAGILADEGYLASAVESGQACLDSRRKKPVDVVLLDIWLPGADGLETLERIREFDNPPEVIMISGHGTIETAVRATKDR